MSQILRISVSVIVAILWLPFQSLAVGQNEPQLNGRPKEIVSESSTWEKGAPVYRQTTRFDERGRIVETGTAFLRVMDDGLRMTQASTGAWAYDDQGRHIKTVVAGSVDMVLTYAYDERGNQIDQTSLDKDGAITLRFLHSYDAEGNRIETKSLKGNGQVIRRYSDEYDTAHRLTQSTEYNEDGSVENRIIHRYDKDGLLKESLIYAGKGALEEKLVNSYLKNGLIAEELRYKSDGRLSSKVSHSYEYDDKGNWTKRTSTQEIIKAGAASPEPPDVIHRAIKYY